MKRKVMGLILIPVLIISYCLVVVTPVTADSDENGNLANSVRSICQFEGYLWYQSDINYGTFKGIVEVLDDGSTGGYTNSYFIICDSPGHMWYGYYDAGCQRQEVVDAEIVEVNGKSAILTLMKTVVSGSICNPQPTMVGKYSVLLIVDSNNPHIGEDCIFCIDGIDGENKAKSIYDSYLATGDTSELSRIDTANCNVIIN